MARKKQPSRRNHGQGGYWTDGKRHYYRYRGQTVADKDSERAKAKLEDLKKRLDQGIRVVDARQSFSQYTTHYLATVLPNEVKKASTLHDYSKRAGYYILPTIGDYRLDTLTYDIGIAWRNAMVEHGWARSSINQALALAKRILDNAVKEHLLQHNPFTSIKPVASKEDIVTNDEDTADGIGKAMTHEQVELFLAAIAGDWLEPLYRLAFFGPRRGELLGFRWSDYNKERMVLWIRQQVTAPDGPIEITTPKSKKSRRTLPLLDEHIEMIDRYRVDWLERKMRYRDKWHDEYDLMFCTKYGTPIYPRNLLRHFYNVQERLGWGEWVDKEVMTKNGIEKRQIFECWFRFHDLRHTANQLLTDAEVGLKVRAAILGHSRVQITEDVYTHASEEAKREAIKKVRRTR